MKSPRHWIRAVFGFALLAALFAAFAVAAERTVVHLSQGEQPSSGNDQIIIGTEANDHVELPFPGFLTGDNVTIHFGDGDDELLRARGNNWDINGGPGSDSFSDLFPIPNATVNGGPGDDVIADLEGDGMTVFAGEGNDMFGGIFGTGITLDAGPGDDWGGTWIGGNGNVLRAGPGNDLIGTAPGYPISYFGVQGSGNHVDAGFGDDQIGVLGNNNMIDGGPGVDTVYILGSGNICINVEVIVSGSC